MKGLAAYTTRTKETALEVFIEKKAEFDALLEGSRLTARTTSTSTPKG
jgi:hypothetical protein